MSVVADAMAKEDWPRYYREVGGNAFWAPGKFADKYGIRRSVPLGPAGQDAKKAAIDWNAKLDRAREAARSGATSQLPMWRPGTLGSFYELHFKQTDAWALLAPRSREDYERAWPKIAERFADTLVTRISPSDSERFHVDIHPKHPNRRDPKGLQKLSWNEAHRTLKVWRTLLGALVDYRLIPAPPPVGRVSNPEPPGRKKVWLHEEVMALYWACAFAGLVGLALALRIAWDTMLSPIDVRELPMRAWKRTQDGGEVATSRAKTEASVFHAVTPETAELVEAYLVWLKRSGAVLGPDTKLIRRPDLKPYLKNHFEKHFRLARTALFGPDDKRWFLDFRRSGATEARMGDASLEDLGKGMANTLAQSPELQSTYVVGASRRLLSARQGGRGAMKDKFGKSIAEQPDTP
jgi:hypothetical protein